MNVLPDQPTDVVDKPAHVSDLNLTEDLTISTVSIVLKLL